MAHVKLENVSKRFPDGTVAVDGIHLEVQDQEFLVLVGPSGCGKSTTLRMIAGLEGNTAGEIWIGERRVDDVAPKDRDLAMVFQNYALYPHMSVYRNLSFGLTLRNGGGAFGGGVKRALTRIFNPDRAAYWKQQRSGIDEQVRQAANRLGIEHLLDRKPHQLSGGERQRVALGRAIVRNPAAFLFDEPLSNLDAKLRQQMRIELKRLHRDLRATMVYVTHDQIEAMTLGDRVAVMNDGQIMQVGRPLDLYQRPANLFVARFIGNTPINLLPGTVTQQQSAVRFQSESGWTLTSVPEAVETMARRSEPAEVTIGFRSEDLQVEDELQAGTTKTTQPVHRFCFAATVEELDHLGDTTLVHARIQPSGASGTNQDRVTSTVLARVSPDSNLKPGDRVDLQVDQNRLLWFDSKTGQNLLRD